MLHLRPALVRLIARASILGLGLGMVLGPTAPADAAPAPNNCNQPNFSIGVQFLNLSSASNLTMTAQLDGSFAGRVNVRVFCNSDGDPPVDIGEVTGAQVRICTSVPATLINGQTANCTVDSNGETTGSFALIDVPTGTTTVTISSPNPGLDLANGQWSARVGQDTMVVTQAFNSPVPTGGRPIQIGNIFARTPELGSLVLFGAGAIGLSGFALLARRRSARTP